MSRVIDDSVTTKSVKGSFFSIGSSAVTIVSGFVRSVLLARLLAPSDFGIVALALFFLSIGDQVRDFGFNQALIHREKDISKAASTHFVLKLSLAVIVAILTFALAPLLRRFYPAQHQMVNVLLCLSLVKVLGAANSTPNYLLRKELDFKYLAALDVATSLTMTITTPLMALAGLGYWALVGEQIVGVVVQSIAFWGIRRPWNLSLDFDLDIARWYFRFGSFVFLTTSLTFLLDQFDDFWAGTALGTAALGFYSRAYEFAHYPRRMIAAPINRVFFPTYAKLQHDRLRLSKAYYRAGSLMIRAGFLFTLILILIIPEFVRIFLGSKWLPMVLAFRLMVIYTLLDPLVVMSGNLVTAVGSPQVLTRIKALQLLTFVPAVIMLAHFLGIEGIALAADLMLVIGLILIIPHVRRFVDFSLWKMFRYPIIGFLLGGVTTFLIEHYIPLMNDWLSLFVKGGTAALIYTLLLVIFEHNEIVQGIKMVSKVVISPNTKRIT